MRIRRWINSELSFYGLRRDLTAPYEPPPANLAIRIRPLLKSDIPALLKESGQTGQDIYELMARREFIKMHPRECYVAVTQDGEPCYMQWLITPAENEQIQLYFGGLFPWLSVDEVLLEQAYTVGAFRGLGVMPLAMSRIAEMGRGCGARWAITFVAQDNIPALKGCERAGFRPYLIRRENWRWFHRRFAFQSLPPGTLYPFENTNPENRSLMNWR